MASTFTNRFQYIADYIFQTSGAEKVQVAQEKVVKATQAMNSILAQQKAGFKAASLGAGQYSTTTNKAGQRVTAFKQSITDMDGKIRDVSFSSGRLGRNTQILQNSFGTATQSSKEYTKSLAAQTAGYGKLALRAIAVVPIWMAIRGAYTGVIGVFTEGIQVMREMDAAMLKAEAVIHDSSMGMVDSIQNLRGAVIGLSQETGTSMNQLGESFYRFGTVGLDYETSMAGMTAANKAAIAMMGKTDDFAKVLARTFRLLGHTMDQTLPVQQQLEVASGKLFLLYQDNAFEIEGMNQSLLQFLPTANTANFTFDQTIALLAALNSGAVQGSRAGRLLRTSIAQLVKNYGDVAEVLGVSVNPNMETQFEILMKILTALNRLTRSGKDVTKVSAAMEKIFGGVRGQETIKALVSMFDLLESNLDKTQTSAKETMDILDERVERVVGGFDRQIERLDKIKKSLKLTFLQGLVGGNDFADTVERLNTLLAESQDEIKGVGNVAAQVFQGLAAFRSPEALGSYINRVVQQTGQLLATPVQAILEPIVTPDIYGTRDKIMLMEAERKNKEAVAAKRKADLEREKAAAEERLRQEDEAGRADISEVTRTKLNKLKEELKYIDLQTQGYTKQDIVLEKLKDHIQRRVEIHNALTDHQENGWQLLESQHIVALALAGDWEKIKELLQITTVQEEKLLAIAKKVRDVEKERSVELEKIAGQLKSAFQTGVESMLTGGDVGLFEGLSKAMSSIMVKQIAKGITDALFKSSGMGDSFARHAVLVEQAIKRGADYHAARLTGGKVSGQFATGGMAGGGFGGLGGFLDTPIFGGGTTTQRPPGFIGPMPRRGFATGGAGAATLGQAGGVGLLAYGAGSSFNQAAGGGGLGMAAGIAGGVGAGIVGAAGLGMFAAGAVGAGAAGFGVALTAGLANAWNPVGWALLAAAAVMSIIGMNKGKPEWTKEDTQEQTKAIGSRIDVTNKQLEWVNRNLVALRQEITFILPESAYFSERAPEDRFALDSQRGF